MSLVTRDEAAFEGSELSGRNGASRLRHEPQVKVKILEGEQTLPQRLPGTEKMPHCRAGKTRNMRVPLCIDGTFIVLPSARPE